MTSLQDEAPDDEKHPPDLVFDEDVLEVAFHPTEQIVAAGLLDGRIELYRYSDDGNVRVAQLDFHKKSCRALQFSDNGAILFTGSSDKTLRAVNLQTQSVFYKEAKAHEDAINALLRLNENSLASGDDSGAVKVWDLRQQKAVRNYDAQSDFVSDMLYVDGGIAQNTLLVTSGDGTLAVYDLRQNKVMAQSDQLEDELLSLALMKGGSKIVCGSQDGIINLFSWGMWGDISDRFPGHPNSIDTMVAIDDQILLTGSSDGLIRVVTILPNEFVGVVGEHADFPIERIRLSPSHKYLASCSHDHTVKFWNVDYLYDADGDDDDGDADNALDTDQPAAASDAMDVDDHDESSGSSRSSRGRPKKKGKATASKPDFFADM